MKVLSRLIPPMICVHDRGRLCNNILQYGHLYAWGREHGVATMSMRFAYKYQFFHICHTPHHNFPTYVLAKYAAKCGLIPTVDFDNDQRTDSERERLMLERRWLVVTGWNVRYYDLFLKYKHEILNLFAFDEAVSEKPRQLLSTVAGGDLKLGLHIRRGDYRTWHDGRYYYDDTQYISQVRSFMQQHSGQRVHLFICGNDPALDVSLYRRELPEATVSFSQGSPAEDLYLLSQCDWLMGPPSTFTLVASMYRDVPLCWIHDASCPVTADSFRRFDYLFQHIL